MSEKKTEGNNTLVMAIVGLAIFAAGWFGGSIWKENKLLKSGGLNNPTKQEADSNQPQPQRPKGPSEEQLNKMPKVTSEDHALGNPDKAKVVLVEYSDFECPFCKRFHPTVKKVVDEYQGKVAVIWRNFPLAFHPNAQKAAETAECVAKNAGNDAFWKYTDLYFEKTDSSGTGVSEDEMLDLAQKAGANKSKVAACVKSGEMKDKVKKQMDGGSTAGVSGTPGTIVVVDGKAKELIPGALPYEQVKQIVDKYVK